MATTQRADAGTPVEPRTLSGNFELTIVLTDKRQLRMTGYVYSDDDQYSINDRIDQFQNVMDRQFIRCDIVNKEAQIASYEAGLAELAAHNEEMQALAKKGSLTSTQQQHMSQFESNVRLNIKQRKQLEAQVAAARKKLNGAGA